MRQDHLAGLAVITPTRHEDERGYFVETFNARRFAAETGEDIEFVQDNESMSMRGVVRGLHYQVDPAAQGKLVRATVGAVFDVAVDLRASSSTFGDWFGIELSAESGRQLWIPRGFAHGFVALAEVSVLAYKTTDFYAPDSERTIRWDDETIAIQWPVQAGAAIVSDKDRQGSSFADADLFE